MIAQLVSIREALADVDASDSEEVGKVVDLICDELDDLIADERSADAQVVTELVAPANGYECDEPTCGIIVRLSGGDPVPAECENCGGPNPTALRLEVTS